MTIETLNTVDDRSSLFVGDQCLWVTLAHKFTSPDELVYTNICLIFIETIPNLPPTKLRPNEQGTQIKMIPQ